ncbi:MULTISPECIES: hypothetical protein [Xanthomonas]|uniref:hypothetical protein n=1 Tax=Xanthomonas TaxID=338 RepID=UPI0006F87200|nr:MULTISPECIES: hypothetical protein [Xanthomonas]KQR07239.1 hypothetical protein ASF90_20340 [Xanthomonas sp. Leaf148]
MTMREIDGWTVTAHVETDEKGKSLAGILSRRIEGRTRHILWLRGFKFRSEREAREHAERVIAKIRGVTGEGIPIPF